MKFVIRDDDVCAFTRPEELERCYRYIWDRMPVNLSVTPFRIPGDDRTLPDQIRGEREVMPLEDNQELVAFLRQNIAEGRLGVALHGYHHSRPNGLPEYVSGDNLHEKTRKGKAYLERVLGCTVSTFVPPYNQIGRAGLQAVINNGLNLIGMPSFVRRRHRRVRIRNLPRFIHAKYYHMRHKVSYPYVLKIDGHKEVNYFSVTPSQHAQTLLDGFEKMVRLDGVFVCAVHYHAFERRLRGGELIRDVVHTLVAKASETDGVESCTYDQLWSAQ